MHSTTPRLPRFEKTQDVRGYVSWRCNYCGWGTRQPQYPKSHKCGNWNRRTRSGRNQNEEENTGSRLSNREDESSENEFQTQPSPFNIGASSTPPGQPPIGDLDPRQLLQQQMFMQQQMFQQQENFKQFMANQQEQFLQSLQKQQETIANKDNVVKEILEDAKKKEENTNKLLEVMQNQSLNSRRIPCPKWSKEESYKTFSSRLKHWDKHYKSKGKYLELLESLQETGRTTEKARIELEVRNGVFDPDEEDVIAKISAKLDTIFGKPKMDELLGYWDSFSDMLREEDEDLEEFILKLETAEAGLRALDCPVDKKIMSLVLMKAINLDKNEKRNQKQSQ